MKRIHHRSDQANDAMRVKGDKSMKYAVLIPCYNEEVTIGKVIDDFNRQLPDADIYVYDNNSQDRTGEIAAAHGAKVRNEYRQGKGNVVRAMFKDINADIYIMVDGDDTYPADFVHQMIEPILNAEADMVIGDRLSNGSYLIENKRAYHNFGNILVKNLINWLFKSDLQDIMTGYRAFNKKFVKNMPVMSAGFEVETEISIQALDKRFLIKEIPIDYRDRPEGSFSKLNTWSDGSKVVKTVFWLFKDYRPLMFFTALSLLFFLLGLAAGIPVVKEFIEIRYVHKVPSAILAVGFMVFSSLSLVCGLILDTLVKQNKAAYELILTHFQNQ